MNFKKRSAEKEWMDEPGIGRERIQETLRYLHLVNELLGGNRNLTRGLDFFIKKFPQKQQWHILDLGCADGKSLEIMTEWAKRAGHSISLSGLDINPSSINMAQENPQLQHVNFIVADIFDPTLDFSDVDIVTGNLFFHHLSDKQIINLMQKVNNAGCHLLINDLQRSRLAWVLFLIFTYLTSAPKMAKNDGEVSIRRSFRKRELEELAVASGFRQFKVKWNWAFRYLVTLFNEKKTS